MYGMISEEVFFLLKQFCWNKIGVSFIIKPVEVLS